MTIIGGMQKQSFIDYPGKIGCVVFLDGCNFTCPYCHNPQLVRKGREPARITEDKVFAFLESRKGFLDGVVISGGEPTLQKDLPEFCDTIRKMGFPVKLDTNGSRPRIVRELIEKGRVNYLAMDIKTDPQHYPGFITRECSPETLLSSIDLIMTSGLPYEFKTTCIRPLADDGVIADIARIIRGARLYALQQFHEADILNPEFFKTEDRLFTDADLLRFRDIAAPFVEECAVR